MSSEATKPPATGTSFTAGHPKRANLRETQKCLSSNFSSRRVEVLRVRSRCARIREFAANGILKTEDYVSEDGAKWYQAGKVKGLTFAQKEQREGGSISDL